MFDLNQFENDLVAMVRRIVVEESRFFQLGLCWSQPIETLRLRGLVRNWWEISHTFGLTVPLGAATLGSLALRTTNAGRHNALRRASQLVVGIARDDIGLNPGVFKGNPSGLAGIHAQWLGDQADPILPMSDYHLVPLEMQTIKLTTAMRRAWQSLPEIAGLLLAVEFQGEPIADALYRLLSSAVCDGQPVYNDPIRQLTYCSAHFEAEQGHAESSNEILGCLASPRNYRAVERAALKHAHLWRAFGDRMAELTFA